MDPARQRSKIGTTEGTGAAADVGRAVLIVFYLLSFLSGAAALIYEVTWARLLSLTFGSTTLSVAAVVAGFMGGMGIGARLYHHVDDRVASPLRAYACLEIAIAVAAALLSVSLGAMPYLFADIARVIGAGAMMDVVRFAIVLLILLVPAMLMGATFPALCSVVIQNARGVDRHLGLIYGINTVGAAVGVLLAALFLVERVGLYASTLAANGVNVAVGVTAFAMMGTRLGRRIERRTLPAPQAVIPTSLSRRVTSVVLIGSGFTTLAYEILWFRSLHYLVGNATYAISTMLVVFLAGLGLGALLLERIAARRSPERDLAWCQIGIAVLALGAMACQWLVLSQPALRDHVSIFSDTFRFRPWWWRLGMSAGVGAVIMLPATLLMGLSFPLASRLYLGDVRRLGDRLGGAYLLANVGGAAGSIGAAVVLLPALGTIGGTKAVAAMNLALGALVLVAIGARRPRTIVLPAVAASIVVVAVVLLPRAHDLRGEPITADDYGRLVFVEEGDLATVQVLVDPEDETKLAMSIDGYKIGWSGGFRGWNFHRKEILLAHLPMVLDPRIRRTLNVGLASGTTLKTLAAYPETETLDCVEINAAVVRANRLFPESDVLDDPRVELIIDDAVNYLLRTDATYDLIISDGKQHPFYSGNATLLCREFYEFALDRLTPDGLFVQWIQLSMLHEDFLINLRTLCDVFPEVEVFFYPRWDVYMVASRQPVLDRTHMRLERFAAAAASDDLADHAIAHPASLLSHATAGRKQLESALPCGPISTWDHMILDFTAYKAPPSLWRYSKRDNLSFLVRAEAAPRSNGALTLEFERRAYARSAQLVRQAFAAYYAENLPAAQTLARQAVRANPGDAIARSTAEFFEQEAALVAP